MSRSSSSGRRRLQFQVELDPEGKKLSGAGGQDMVRMFPVCHSTSFHKDFADIDLAIFCE